MHVPPASLHSVTPMQMEQFGHDIISFLFYLKQRTFCAETVSLALHDNRLTSLAPSRGGVEFLNCFEYILHIPESRGTGRRGQLPARDRGNGLKAQPVVYRWTNGAGWAQKAPASCEVVRMKAVNHKPVNRPKGTLAL